MTIIEMRVHMDCAGCETKIKKALKKLDGVDEVDMDIAMQKVTVMGWADQRKVLKTVRKTGGRAELWPYPYNPEYQNFTQHYYYYQYHQQPQQQYHSHNPNRNYSFQQQPPPPSYNYKKHGYSGDFGYYQQSPYSHILMNGHVQ